MADTDGGVGEVVGAPARLVLNDGVVEAGLACVEALAIGHVNVKLCGDESQHIEANVAAVVATFSRSQASQGRRESW